MGKKGKGRREKRVNVVIIKQKQTDNTALYFTPFYAITDSNNNIIQLTLPIRLYTCFRDHKRCVWPTFITGNSDVVMMFTVVYTPGGV